MAKKDPRVDAYIKGAAPFARPILTRLRKIVHTGCPQVEETIRWKSPFFDYKGPICLMAAFKQHCVFGFWKGSLLFGKKNQGAMGHFGRITSMEDLPSEKELIGYIRKAAELNESGIQKSRPRSRAKQTVKVPADLKVALKSNSKARTTFGNFSYSHKKEYVDWITDAKREETRKRRLATTVKWLSQGKVQNWRYL
jgi:uncharacterized protein YdeI (YjbR/CyaY-like superfamily)